MKIILGLTIIYLIGLGNCFSQTSIIGGEVSGNWTKEKSPYLIEGAIMIANGTSLSIEPGVKVEFQGSYKFLVLGQLLAIGNIDDSITFTSIDTTIGWLGIRFENTTSTNDSSLFLYCRFTYGKATGASPYNSGGAFYFSNFSKARISYSRFSHCSAIGAGGAICSLGSSPLITNNQFSNNYTPSSSAIYSNNFSVGPTISENTFLDNYSTSIAGAISIAGSATINNNIFKGNWSYSYSGSGAIHITMGSNPNIYNNKFVNNSCSYGGGGAIFVDGSSSTIISNNIFSNNSALKGGAIYSYGCSPIIINNTFSNNNATYGGALFCTVSSPTVSNCIMWGNKSNDTENQVYLNDESSDPDFYYCDIQGGQSAISIVENSFYLGDYINNIDTNPEFIAPTAGSGLEYDGISADLSLQPNSQCVNAGNLLGSYPEYDIAGNPRVYDDTIDIGAYEYSDNFIDITKYKEYSSFILYPNPTSGIFKLQFNNDNIYVIEIFNSLGEKICSTSNFNSQKSIQIDMSDVPSGIYFAKINGGQKLRITTIIKK